MLRLGTKTLQRCSRLFQQISSEKQRAAALFFVVGMVLGTLLPTASAYAAYKPDSSNPNIKNRRTDDPNKKMKQNYPRGMSSTVATSKAAADTQAFDPKDRLNESKVIKGETLRELGKSKKITPHELTERRTATSSVSVNADGSLTERHFMTPKHFQ